MSSPEEWFRNLPKVTKVYFCAAVVSTLLTTFKLLTPAHYYLDFDLVFFKLHIWRLITNFLFFGGFGMPFVINIVILVQTFNRLESEYYTGARGLAEFIYMLAFCVVALLCLGFVLNMYFLSFSLVAAATYIWSRKDPRREIMFYGFKLQAWVYPFVFMAVNTLMGGSWWNDLMGIVVGHLYHFLADVVPEQYNTRLLATPQFLYDYFEPMGARRPAANWQRQPGYRVAA